MSRMLPIAVLAGLSASASGCGSATSAQTIHSANHAGSAPVPTALIAHSHPNRPASASIARAQAQAFGRAVNLTVADVPGAIAYPREKKNHNETHNSREFDRCTGAQHVREIAEVKSPRLQRGKGVTSETFSSSVTISANASLAFKEYTAVRSARVRACVTRVLRKRFLGKSLYEARYGSVAVGLPPIRIPGAEEGIALRFTTTVISPRTGRSIPIYTDQIGFVLGPAEISLQTSSIVQPVATTTEEQLLLLLLERAKANTP
jgi:hypothetical protein